VQRWQCFVLVQPAAQGWREDSSQEYLNTQRIEISYVSRGKKGAGTVLFKAQQQYEPEMSARKESHVT
jgi:hypothetical protein